MKRDKDEEKFYQLVEFLTINDYNVNIDKELTAEVNGHGIIAFFSKKNDSCNKYINGNIVADNESSFDKIANCPVRMKIPKGKRGLHRLLDILKWLSTEQGYEVSNNYEFDYWVIEV